MTSQSKNSLDPPFASVLKMAAVENVLKLTELMKGMDVNSRGSGEAICY